MFQSRLHEHQHENHALLEEARWNEMCIENSEVSSRGGWTDFKVEGLQCHSICRDSGLGGFALTTQQRTVSSIEQRLEELPVRLR